MSVDITQIKGPFAKNPPSDIFMDAVVSHQWKDRGFRVSVQLGETIRGSLLGTSANHHVLHLGQGEGYRGTGVGG